MPVLSSTTRGRGRWTALAAVLLFAGAAAGGGYGAVVPAHPSAELRIVIAPDPLLPDEAAAGSAADDRFIQTQTLVLTGDRVQRAVQQALSLVDLPTLVASQVGLTDVVAVSASASKLTTAKAVVRAAVSTYQQQRQAGFELRVDSAAKAVENQLISVRKTLSLPPSPANNAERTAAAEEYTQLSLRTGQLKALRAGYPALVRLGDQPSDTTASRASHLVRQGLIGLLLGGALALGLLLIARSRRAL